MTDDDDLSEMKRKVVKDWELLGLFWGLFLRLLYFALLEASPLVAGLMKRSVLFTGSIGSIHV